MKKVVCLILALSLVFALVACGGTAEPSTAPSESTSAAPSESASQGGDDFDPTQVVIGFSPTSMRDYYVAVREGVEEGCEAEGCTYIAYDPNGDAATQATQMLDMVSAGCSGIVMVACDTNGIRNTATEIRSKGCYLVAVDAEIPEADYDCLDAMVTSDNTQLGYISGEDMAKRYPEGGGVLIGHATVFEGCVLTVNGFWQAIKDNAENPDNFKELYVCDADGTTDKAYPVFVDAFQAYGKDTQLVYCINDPTALAAMNAAEGAGYEVGADGDKIHVYGKDGSPEGKALIKEGKQVQSSAQSPIGLGKMGVVRIFQLLRGEEFEFFEKLPASNVTAENVDEFGVTTWQ